MFFRVVPERNTDRVVLITSVHHGACRQNVSRCVALSNRNDFFDDVKGELVCLLVCGDAVVVIMKKAHLSVIIIITTT